MKIQLDQTHSVLMKTGWGLKIVKKVALLHIGECHLSLMRNVNWQIMSKLTICGCSSIIIHTTNVRSSFEDSSINRN